MFEVGFSEIALIALVALLVLGPERLPGVARTVGALVKRARNSWQSVRGEIERELAAEDMKRSINEARKAADFGNEIRSAAADIERSASAAAASSPAPAPSPASPSSPAPSSASSSSSHGGS